MHDVQVIVMIHHDYVCLSKISTMTYKAYTNFCMPFVVTMAIDTVTTEIQRGVNKVRGKLCRSKEAITSCGLRIYRLHENNPSSASHTQHK